MKLKSISPWSALALLLATTACQKSSPARATDLDSSAATASVTDATTGTTVTTPAPVTPAANQQFKYSEQPLTLTVKNAVSTGTSPLTYVFEVATDAAFANKVYTKDGVAGGASGQTAQRLDTLAGEKTYFWRSHVTSGSTVGPNSAARSFTVGPQVILQAPALLSPAQNGTASGNPTLTVANAARTGPAGAVFYRFEVSTSASFQPLVFVNTVAEQAGGQTSVTVPVASNTPAGVYFWRAQATDPSNIVTSAFSTTFSFNYQPFDMRQAIVVDSPPDLGFWPETAKITSVQFTPDAFLVDFDRRDGSNRWRDLDFGDGHGDTLQYTLGMCGNLNRQWYCSAVIQFWYGRDLRDTTPPSYVARNWFYDSRWGPMMGYQPEDGETVGLFAASGNVRDRTFTQASCPQVCERTNVMMVTWHNDGFANYSGIAGLSALTVRKK
jgi:hypothetical protein